MTVKQADKWLDDNWDTARMAFQKVHTGPTGGLCNPTVVAVDSHGHLEVRCYYDGYDNDEDAWTWFLDPKTMHWYS